MSVDSEQVQQTIVSSEPVTVSPTTAAAVKTEVAGPATIEAALATEIRNNPNWIVAGIAVVLLFGMAVIGWAVYEWIANNNPRAGELATAVGGPIGVVLAYLLGWISPPPKAR